MSGVGSEGIKQGGDNDEKQENKAEVMWTSPNRLI